MTTTPSKPEASLRELHDYSGFGFGLDADTLTDLNKCIAWLRERRMRIHATDCTVHQPSAQCSCGLHYVLSTLGFVGNDVETALAQPAARQEAGAVERHPSHFESRLAALSPVATPPASGEAGAWKPTTLAFTADGHGVRVSMSEADFNDLRRLAAVAPASGDIDAMVNRFLGWPLPKDFSPDCGISFDGRQDDEWNKNKTWPIGTNLFTAAQAKAMFAHCVAAVAPAGMDGWQPIATAPKDGTRVLLCNPAWDSPLTGTYDDGEWRDFGFSFTHEPTHWQPLPTPPATAGEE